ncbi:MAG: radical SAM protein, partial [Myxococcota bacterium]
TPDTELSDMMLIEPERGCHRGCTFCVMRRSTNGGMRLVPPEVVTALVADDVPKVGLVGAAVTDHPGIKQILRELVDVRGKRIGVSSLRADRLDDEFVGLLARGGYRSMTVALDAASARLRDVIEKNIKDRHVQRAASLAKANGMRHLKLYVIVGLPEETDEDRAELVELILQLKKTLPIVLGVSPFVPKFHTPLAAAPFLGERGVDNVLKDLRRRLAPAGVQLRGPGAREAYVEYRLSQGGCAHAEAAVAAARAGGKLSHYKRALRDLPERQRPTNFEDLVPAPTFRRGRLATAVLP